MIKTITVKFIDSCYYLDNGNIRKQTIKNLASGSWYDYIYTFTYDLANRLTNAVCNRSQYSETYSYDADGNIMSRTGSTSNPTITYSYTSGTNRLAQVTQSSTPYTFAYDAKGNMTTDNYSGVTGITYDRRNLPLSMTKGTDTYTYRYNDKGERTRKVMGTANEYYLHDHTGRELAVWDKSTNTLKMVNLYGAGMVGRVEINGTTYSTYYYVKDHLGSIRQTLNSSGVIVSGQDYYPYGALIRSYDNSDPNSKYKFTEKERDALTNYDYFGARYLNSQLGRWLTPDPLADKYPGWSPYNYCFNNPIGYFDTDGNEAYSSDGRYVYRKVANFFLGAGEFALNFSPYGSGIPTFIDKFLLNNDPSYQLSGKDATTIIFGVFGKAISKITEYANMPFLTKTWDCFSGSIGSLLGLADEKENEVNQIIDKILFKQAEALGYGHTLLGRPDIFCVDPKIYGKDEDDRLLNTFTSFKKLRNNIIDKIKKNLSKKQMSEWTDDEWEIVKANLGIE